MNIVDEETKQLLETAELVRVLIDDVVVAWDDVHDHAALAHRLKERLATVIQRLEVDVLPMVIEVSKVDDLLYAFLIAVGKESEEFRAPTWLSFRRAIFILS